MYVCIGLAYFRLKCANASYAMKYSTFANRQEHTHTRLYCTDPAKSPRSTQAKRSKRFSAKTSMFPIEGV